MTPAHDPSGSLPRTVEDEQAPAAVVPADLGARQVNGAVSLRRRRIIPEERACLRPLGKDASVVEQGYLVRIDRHFRRLARILVADQETVIPVIGMDRMDQAKVAAAFAALVTLKRQKAPLPDHR